MDLTCTKVNGRTSSKLELSYGITHASILGPLLFIVYVNDLFNEIEDTRSILMYADDNGKGTEESIDKSQKVLDNVTSWCHLNKIMINMGKT